MLAFVLMLVAVILFILAAWSWPNPPKISLLALGLAFMAASFCFQLYPA